MILEIPLIALGTLAILAIIGIILELLVVYLYDPEEEYRALEEYQTFIKNMYGTQNKKPPMRTIHAVEIDESKKESEHK